MFKVERRKINTSPWTAFSSKNRLVWKCVKTFTPSAISLWTRTAMTERMPQYLYAQYYGIKQLNLLVTHLWHLWYEQQGRGESNQATKKQHPSRSSGELHIPVLISMFWCSPWSSKPASKVWHFGVLPVSSCDGLYGRKLTSEYKSSRWATQHVSSYPLVWIIFTYASDLTMHEDHTLGNNFSTAFWQMPRK